ncbi:hypothetical protein PISMIDRAFT_687904 [Pisolithus microcarpus 441]|uniref:Uncharacterized protein n=1 Tax=Pisolithus microcarpus 441 TaxID=765257 RepID=A0A0C9YWM2_9AGAM|nr:hypothetical protein PISMIDRAFT_687904 [Pisolithus microcarpus 441]
MASIRGDHRNCTLLLYEISLCWLGPLWAGDEKVQQNAQFGADIIHPSLSGIFHSILILR